ncbi:uncharacterized protein LOC143599366 [Bidens hawaiensis]|uniref:uncharacterized protein LOC143599366 n=1 Tax=Bidens hawaiensis TaxID=980011 RepID=UPI00404A860B
MTAQAFQLLQSMNLHSNLRRETQHLKSFSTNHLTFDSTPIVPSVSINLHLHTTSSNLLNQDDDFTHHIVSLTSTTYGLLTLDPPASPTTVAPTPPRFTSGSPPDDVINSWELMAGLDSTPEAFNFTPQSSKPSPFRYPFDRNHENSNPNHKNRIFTRPGFSRFQDNPNPDHKNPIFTNPNCKNSVFTKPLVSTFQENPNPDHKFQENQNPDHEFQENPNPDHKFQENQNPDHEFQENPNPDHKFQENPNSDDKNLIFTKPIISAFQENPSPDHKNPIFTKPVVSEPDYLSGFEPLCPPKGENKLVIYTTTLRGVRKTFEACNAVRAVLEQSGLFLCERDISMDGGFKEELWELMKGKDKQECVPPRVFVKGRYVGGSDEVLRIVEDGCLGQLLEGLTKLKPGYVCETCGGARFLPCSGCNGSCKLVMNVEEEIDESDGDQLGKTVIVKCSDCNENGLVRCPVCS